MGYLAIYFNRSNCRNKWRCGLKSKDSTGDINKILDDYEKTLISIYDLKDILDPNGKYAAR